MATPDFTSFKAHDPQTGKRKGKESPKNPEAPLEQWWSLEGKNVAQSVTATIDFLQKHQDNRMQSLAIATKLYGSQGLGMFPWGSPVSPFPSVNSPTPYMTNRITLNIIQSAVDTVTAKMAKSSPEPFFLTSKGDYRKRRKAKYLNGFSRGMFYEQRVHQKMNLAF